MDTTNGFDPLFFSTLAQPCRFYILRHGETSANAERRIQGRADYDLNAQGQAQARAAAPWFADKKIARVYCSPQLRARRTAAIVAQTAGLADPQPLAELMELDTGCFTDLTLAEAEVAHPALYKDFRSRSWEALPDAESSESLFARAVAAWSLLRQAALEADGNILAVSHGGFIQWLVRSTFGCRSWLPLLSTGNCALFELHVQPQGPAVPAFMHWAEINLELSELPQIKPVF